MLLGASLAAIYHHNPFGLREHPLTFSYSDKSMALCPKGFVRVPADDEFAHEDFCVMKFDAKALDQATGQIILDGCGGLPSLHACNVEGRNSWGNFADLLPASVSEGAPWRRISFYQAHQACGSLGDRYQLITNREWMAIARNIEQNAHNWTKREREKGSLAQGLHKVPGIVGERYKTRNHPAPEASARCLYAYSEERRVKCSRAGNPRFRRTLVLSTGDVVWDLAGNVWTWVDAMEDGTPVNGNVCGTDDSWATFPECDFQAKHGYAPVAGFDKRFEIGPRQRSATGAGVGMIASSISEDRVFRRGGSWQNEPASGVFSLDLRSSPFAASSGIGFRCTYRPLNDAGALAMEE